MSEIKGVLLCGGLGTRLRPLTIAMNKHLLRVGKRPMLEHPLRRMIEAGVRNIHVVVGGESFPPVVAYLGSGSRWGIRITYSVQDKPGGIAEALGMAQAVVGNDKMLVVLGDNMFDMDLSEEIRRFKMSTEEKEAVLFSIHSGTPERFGVLQFGEKNEPVDVIEKPTNPPSDQIVTGIYMYTADVFDVIETLKPSGRGELEITDVNRMYVKFGRARIVKMHGRWTDCGTFDTLLVAEEIMEEWNGDHKEEE